MNAFAILRREFRASAGLWLALVVAFFATAHLLQLALLVLRFQAWPNYLTLHDWSGNIARIVRMTPSISDVVSISLDEWLIEIGSMNFAYGHGVSEWSFVVVPAKAALMLTIAVLLATDMVLLRSVRRTCPLSERLAASFAATSGAFMAALSAMTITWVVCCAAPTWIVGLAVMGVATATAFELQAIGGWLALFGVMLLAIVGMMLAWQLCDEQGREEPAAEMPTHTHIARVPS